MEHGRKDRATVTEGGERLLPRIEGVMTRPAVTQLDERGDICEIFNPAWGFADAPLVYVYAMSVRPGKVKGWVYHREQMDRLFCLSGFVKIVLYDLREDSPTHGTLLEMHVGERNRTLLTIPPLVAHAVQNIGAIDASMINMPDRPYRHADPDKYRLDPASVPFTFDNGPGW